MASLKKIKTLNNGTYNVVDVLASFLLNNLQLKEYDITRAYSKDDKIIRVNATTKKYEILRATVNTVAGAFVAGNWTLDNIHDSVQNSSFVETITVQGSVKPTQTTNQVWFDNIIEKAQIDPDSFTL